MKRLFFALGLLASLSFLTACGQKGALYFAPENPVPEKAVPESSKQDAPAANAAEEADAENNGAEDEN